MIRVCKEESFHQRQGYDIMMTLARGSAELGSAAFRSILSYRHQINNLRAVIGYLKSLDSTRNAQQAFAIDPDEGPGILWMAACRRISVRTRARI
jgi:hypothetical protein